MTTLCWPGPVRGRHLLSGCVQLATSICSFRRDLPRSSVGSVTYAVQPGTLPSLPSAQLSEWAWECGERSDSQETGWLHSKVTGLGWLACVCKQRLFHLYCVPHREGDLSSTLQKPKLSAEKGPAFQDPAWNHGFQLPGLGMSGWL